MHNLNELYKKLTPPKRYALAAAIFIVALTLRLVAIPVESGLQFMTFYPAMIVSFYLCGIGPGVLVVVLCAIAADYFFAPPFWGFSESRVAFGPIITFLISSLMIGVMIKRMRRESSKNLALLRNASDGIHILDYTGNIIEASDSFCAMLGYRRDEIIGMNVSQWDVGFPNPEALMAAVRKQFEKPVRTQFETCHRRKNGTILDVEVSGFPLELDGRPVLFNSSRDITARKQAEGRANLLLESIDSGVWGLDTKGNTTFINSTATAMLGYEPAELIGQPMHATAHHAYPDGSHYPREECPICATLADGKRRTITDEVLWRKDGSSFPVEYTTHPIYSGKALIGVAVVFQDITERNKAEAEIRIAATAFESQEGMMITDANSQILRVNRAFTNITGYTAEEVIGKNPRILNSGLQDEIFYAAMWQSIHSTGEWEGEIWNRRKNGDLYAEHLSITAVKDANGKIINYVAALTDITQRKEAEKEIQHLAFYDHLTDLPNRLLLTDRLQQAIASSGRSGQQCALLFIDLDNFKTLNDTLGHDMGDLLLQQVAQRLVSCVREDDTVARLGGDEFVVVLENLNGQPYEAAEQAETVCEKIITLLSQPYQLSVHEYNCTPSIGIAMFDAQGDNGAEDLLKQADIAMYQAKNAGRSTLRFFDPQMQEAINTRAALESELRNALEKGQFQLYYQIQMTSSYKPVGAEALIRWMHPEHGMMSPTQFIPLAEETGLIQPIGLWVLETACAQLAAWMQNVRTKNLSLAINVSAKQFHQPDFASQVQDAVLRHGINPSLLELELTESLLVENAQDTVATMTALNYIGVRISLDDFGTGYSSLQYLKLLPLDQLKIDQTFIRDLATDNNDKVIVRTIIAMAGSLYLDVIAEGVETEEQRKFLMENGCTHFQGHLFGRPEPVEQFEALLAASRPDSVYQK